jgi:hypothetical protein
MEHLTEEQRCIMEAVQIQSYKQKEITLAVGKDK